MLGLPKATELSKQLPKNAIYAKFQMNTAEKAKIDADISRLTIVNEVTAAKINIADGELVKSFFVLLVALKRKDFEEKTIITISKLIPQNMLLILECDGEAKLATYHAKLMQTEWKPKESLSIELKGLNMDAVWENIIVQIGGITIAQGNSIPNSTPLALNAVALQEKFTSEYLSKQIELMLRMQTENPTDAIGKAKELIESCCKTILENEKIAWDKNWDMGKLTGETLKHLNLTPKAISDTDPVAENIKAVLGNLRGITTKLAEIRNPYGSGHGKSASFTGLETRHAKLAVGCSITFVTFLWDTYEGGVSK